MEEFEWNVVNEGHLLDAMVGHKPVGVNKYFQMACICEKFANNLHKDIDSHKIWSHLGTMYNLEALDESETIPFPNNEKEFFLPDSEFGNLINKKEDDKKSQSQKHDTPKTTKDNRKDERSRNTKDTPRRDSKEGKDNNKTPIAKKEIKKETEKGGKTGKGRNSLAAKDDKTKRNEETPKILKRPTRGSLKSNDDSGSSGKSSPITVTPNTTKRRRI